MIAIPRNPKAKARWMRTWAKRFEHTWRVVTSSSCNGIGRRVVRYYPR